MDKLQLEIDGSGTIQSKGQTDDLRVEVNGSGNVRLGDLADKNADVDISGSGKVEVAPQDSLNVDISGSGTIYLRSEPKSIESDFSGSGKIIHANGTVQDRHERHARAGAEIPASCHMGHRPRHRRRDRRDRAASRPHGRAPDPDGIQAAEAKLKAKIRDQVAQELARGSEDDATTAADQSSTIAQLSG